jgi:hypothetical protein
MIITDLPTNVDPHAEELWTRLRCTTQDVVDAAERVQQLAAGIGAYMPLVYAENVESVPTPEREVRDAAMVAAMLDHFDTWLGFLTANRDSLRQHLDGLAALRD